MQTTIQIKLIPTWEQSNLIKKTLKEYIRTINSIVSEFVVMDKTDKRTSKDIHSDMPSALNNQSISDAKGIFKKYKKDVNWNQKQSFDKQKTVKIPVLKKTVAIWNNQNYKVTANTISFPVLINGKSQRLNIKAIIPSEIMDKLDNCKLGTLRISIKNNKFIAQIAVNNEIAENDNKGIMGVDLGLKVPAVAVTDAGKTKFFGNGRQNKYVKRKHRSKRKQLGKEKKLNAIKKLNDKEQRWMKDQDHKISRDIVNYAIRNNVSVIRLEKLANIRNTARTSRKNEKNLHTWSFYRLAQYIEYKAQIEGIKVLYVNPKYTSQICPNCGSQNKAKDRKYQCSCGYHTHRDRVGAINIIYAPVIDGNSLSA